jgi:hypothetical protein
VQVSGLVACRAVRATPCGPLSVSPASSRSHDLADRKPIESVIESPTRSHDRHQLHEDLIQIYGRLAPRSARAGDSPVQRSDVRDGLSRANATWLARARSPCGRAKLHRHPRLAQDVHAGGQAFTRGGSGRRGGTAPQEGCDPPVARWRFAAAGDVLVAEDGVPVGANPHCVTDSSPVLIFSSVQSWLMACCACFGCLG